MRQGGELNLSRQLQFRVYAFLFLCRLGQAPGRINDAALHLLNIPVQVSDLIPGGDICLHDVLRRIAVPDAGKPAGFHGDPLDRPDSRTVQQQDADAGGGDGKHCHKQRAVDQKDMTLLHDMIHVHIRADIACRFSAVIP